MCYSVPNRVDMERILNEIDASNMKKKTSKFQQ